MVNAFEQRFDQPSFAAYAKMESLLVKALNSQDNSRELYSSLKYLTPMMSVIEW